MYKEFEILVEEIAQEIKNFSASLDDAAIRHGAKNRIAGASGFKHQIDVSIEIPMKRLWLVECKRYKSKVALKDMLILIARIDDIRKKRNIDVDVKGVFFTTVGYTWPAKKVGDYNNIELNTIENTKYFAAQLAGNVLIKPPPFESKSNLSASINARSPDRKGTAASAPK